jgi:hypothetical protein
MRRVRADAFVLNYIFQVDVCLFSLFEALHFDEVDSSFHKLILKPSFIFLVVFCISNTEIFHVGLSLC